MENETSELEQKPVIEEIRDIEIETGTEEVIESDKVGNRSLSILRTVIH